MKTINIYWMSLQVSENLLGGVCPFGKEYSLSIIK